MGGRGAKSTMGKTGGIVDRRKEKPNKNSNHTKDGKRVVSVDELYYMPALERIHTMRAIRKREEKGKITKQDKQTRKNYEEYGARAAGYKNTEERRKAVERNKSDFGKAREQWARVNSTTWTRYRNRQTAKFQRWYGDVQKYKS